MGIPEITEECAVAVLAKIKSEAAGGREWALKNVSPCTDEQPILMAFIAESLGMVHEKEDHLMATETAMMQAAFLAMVTYKMLKAAIEAEQLKEMLPVAGGIVDE